MEVKIPSEIGVHVKEGLLGGVYRVDILALSHRFEYVVFLLKTS
jgi:hypothetical protein